MHRDESFQNYFEGNVAYDFSTPDKLITLSEQEEAALGEGDVLRAVKRGISITVGEYINGGGQGDIYLSDLDGYVIKIFKNEERTVFLQKKVETIVGAPNENPNVCWPCDILKTEGGTFVGILIPFVNGKKLCTLASGSRKKLKNNYPNYNRLVQVDMILKILETFKYLHGRNILVADVKLENIMFDPTTMNISLVDMDSIQIGQFNSVQSTQGYDPPEIIQCRKDKGYEEKDDKGNYYYTKYYSDKYRTPKHESYSVSVLIYCFLMGERFPYTYDDWMNEGVQEGTYNPNTLCIEHKFAYGKSSEETKETACEKNIWSHLPSFLKLTFINAFVHNKRYTDDDWIKIFTKYKSLLQSGRLSRVDPNCMEVFPDDQIDYGAVDFSADEKAERTDFSIKRAVVKIAKIMDNSMLEKRAPEIANMLSRITKYTVDSYRFELVYNIGVLKKIKCENIL